MNLFVVGCFAILGFVQAGTYVPGTPGAPWDPKHAEIIRNKIFHLWRTDIIRPNVRNFDLKKYPKGNKGFTDYLYEPDFRLSKVDCDVIPKKDNAKEFGKTLSEKMLLLLHQSKQLGWPFMMPNPMWMGLVGWMVASTLKKMWLKMMSCNIL